VACAVVIAGRRKRGTRAISCHRVARRLGSRPSSRIDSHDDAQDVHNLGLGSGLLRGGNGLLGFTVDGFEVLVLAVGLVNEAFDMFLQDVELVPERDMPMPNDSQITAG